MDRTRQLVWDLAGYLADNDRLANSLPLTLDKLYIHLLDNAVVASREDATKAVESLSASLPHSFVIDLDHGGHLVYYDAANLGHWLNQVLNVVGNVYSGKVEGSTQVLLSPISFGPVSPTVSEVSTVLSSDLSSIFGGDDYIDTSSDSSLSSLTISSLSKLYDSNLKDLRREIMGPGPKMKTLFDDITELLDSYSVEEQDRRRECIMSSGIIPFIPICVPSKHNKCTRHGDGGCVSSVHLDPVHSSSTDVSIGDCSYLDTCFKGKGCKYVHYKVQAPTKKAVLIPSWSLQSTTRAKLVAPQHIQCNIQHIDLSKLGDDYKALIVDPPWDIHTNGHAGPANGTISDTDIARLDIGSLQSDGVIFLWVTGRALDAGRQCLESWGYGQVEELLWCKVNQLGRTICTGRTGHWLNHTKEHVLVGVKGKPDICRHMDVDVIVSTTRGKSQKPTELYGIVERMVGASSRKLELFGRKNNLRPGWLTIGNELEGVKLIEHDLQDRWRLAKPSASRN